MGLCRGKHAEAGKKDNHEDSKLRKHEKQEDIFYINFRVSPGKIIPLKFTEIGSQGLLTFKG